jgi:hypothetical protein
MRRIQRGAALLEFAVALPFSLMLFVGIGDFSAYFWHQTQMEEAARMTAARIAPALAGYAAADAEALHRYAQVLQDEVRKESGVRKMTIALSRDYACPLPSGAEQKATPESRQCKDERVYLRIASDDPVEPLLGPLRALGFPKTAFSRHVVRLH